MAQALRAKSTNIFVWILLLLLIVGLAGFGAGSFGGSFSSVGSVGDEKVSIKTYIRALNNQINQITQQTGQQFSLDQARVLGVDRQVLEQVLAIAALDGQIKQAGISVGDAAVKSQLMDIQAFKGLDGKFDEKAYEFALKQADLSASEYDELLRNENARLLLQNAVSKGIKSNDTYALTLLKFHRQVRSFSWARLSESNLDKPISEPSNSEVDKFYLEHAEKYTSPESKEISYAYLSPEMLFSNIEIETEELKKLYNDNIDQYFMEEKRSVQRLVFSNQVEATNAYSLLQAGSKTFEQLVIGRGLTLEDISLGKIGPTDLDTQASDGIFKSKELGLYGPYSSDLGPAIYQVNAVFDGNVTSFEEAREDLELTKKSEYARKLIDGMIEDLDDLLASGATIEELVLDSEMELKKTSFNLNNDISGVESSNEFKIEANKISEDDYPTLLNTASGSILAMRLDSITPPTLQTLETVKDEVVSDWKKAETIIQLKLVANNLSQKVKNGENFSNLGLVTNDIKGILRSGSIEGLPQSIIPKLFKIKLGEISQENSEKSVFIAKLNSITDFDETAAENKKWIEYLSSQRDAQLAQDYLESFIVAVQDLEGVSIDQKSLNAIQASIGSSQ
jgi:peptidyl-prolyl cis-trans isomerase D